MKKIIGAMVLGVILSACSLGSGTTEPVTDINVTLSGTVSAKGGETYVLQEGGGKSTELHDGNATLSGYVGKKVTVTGQFSGSTLYVDVVK